LSFTAVGKRTATQLLDWHFSSLHPCYKPQPLGWSENTDSASWRERLNTQRKQASTGLFFLNYSRHLTLRKSCNNASAQTDMAQVHRAGHLGTYWQTEGGKAVKNKKCCGPHGSHSLDFGLTNIL